MDEELAGRAQIKSLDEELGQSLDKAWTVLGGKAWRERLGRVIRFRGWMKILIRELG